MTPIGNFWFGVFMLFAGVTSGIFIFAFWRRGSATVTPLDRLERVVSALGATVVGIGEVWVLPRVETLGFAVIFVGCAISVYVRYREPSINSIPQK